MAEYDSSDVIYELDNSGGSLTDITEHVLVPPEIRVKRATDDDWTPLGADVEIKGVVGIDVVDNPTMTLKYNDTTKAFAARGDVRSLEVTLYSGGPSISIEYGITQWHPKVDQMKKTRIEVEGVNTGAITEA
jgi:hypothetical protein